ncbi:glycoside hydrolase family 3 N-terminal domain-containing protein [Demequina sp. SYSU T00192]|uniref:beta-N-acetylhexosaminidase n=1 Tax=Demequina litoralis TaxID=3051660 RepID=A0ABT8G7C8_9MICO|nr:glycoside hydrolase family 3 N-terminal domain-containing protein [Demequina sp. SYSU T00192]MDN4475030.1 glycoside hydrolase family 3 N-terminal domain-containing protein [Demequina sp. SYSU T00192]
MRLRAVAAAVLAAAVLAGCTAGDPAPSPSPSASEASPEATIAAPAPAASSTPSPTPTVETLAWGPTVAEWEDALATARDLPLRRAAGQVIVADLYSRDPAAAAALVREHHLGGVILMGGAAPSADAVAALAARVQRADDRGWPVWVSADEEGGIVSRLSGAVPSLPAFMAAGAATDDAAVTEAYRSSAADMRALGVTVDYAPVADVTLGPADPIIRTRSAGDDPDAVADTVSAAVAGFVDGGVVPVIKHFPGHGSVTVDSHAGLPVQERAVTRLARTDMVPFARAIEAGAPVVMLGHIAVPEWGDDPATLEPEAYAYLREELGFTGVAITDALNMAAVADGRSQGQVAVRALRAGADVLLMPGDVGTVIDEIAAAVRDGRLSRDRLDEAAARSILLARWADGLGGEEPSRAYARTFAAAGTTVAAQDCDRPLVRRRATVVGGPDDAVRALVRELESHGVEVGDGGTSIALLSSGGYRATADVVVSLGGPWGLFDSTADAYVATYGDSAAAIRGLADVLLGDAEPGGDWPVELAGAMPACAA